MPFKETIQRFLNSFGYEIRRTMALEPAMEKEFKALLELLDVTHLQSRDRLYALFKSVEYVVRNKIEGAVVETGVFKGASLAFVARQLRSLDDMDRKIYLYDTFEGWPEPGRGDTVCGAALEQTKVEKIHEGIKPTLEEVRANVLRTGYPAENFVFVKGKVEDTLPGTMPEKIALLRIDTDWHESVYHSLKHLFPRLVRGGVLIVDDYGHWQGAKDAVDQYFSETKTPFLLNRIDYTGRVGIKLS